MHKDFIALENDLVKLMQNVTFKRISNNFQDQMKADIEPIKTNNLYEADVKNDNKLLINKISKTNKKSDSTV